MYVPQDSMWREILKTFWISVETKQGHTLNTNLVMQVWCPRLYKSWLITTSKAYHPWAKGIIGCARSKNVRAGTSGAVFWVWNGVLLCAIVSKSARDEHAGISEAVAKNIFVRKGPRTWRLVSGNLATDYRSHLNHWLVERGYYIWSTRLEQGGGDKSLNSSGNVHGGYMRCLL